MTSTDDALGGGPDELREDSSSIFAIPSYRQRLPGKRDFKAWHRPRKQLVREEVWGEEIDWVLQQKSEGDDVVRYLGLPGPDLLDLRYIYQRFCAPGKNRLKFLGFDEGALPDSQSKDALNVSLQEVRSLEYVDKGSEVLGDDFRLLADRDSIAWETAQRLGPYDIINIDLCGHMAHDEPGLDLTLYNAIHNICSLQNRRPTPWLLLLTSRVNRESVASDALDGLAGAVGENLQTCPEFVNNFKDLVGTEDVSGTVIDGLAGDGFFAFMAVGIAKWLLGIATGMGARFSMSRTFGYQVYGGSDYLDMLAAVYRFEPVATIPPDRFGLASLVPEELSECDQAAKIPLAVRQIVDIDADLKQSPERFEFFKGRMADLLVQARYDANRYFRWLEDKAFTSLSPGL